MFGSGDMKGDNEDLDVACLPTLPDETDPKALVYQMINPTLLTVDSRFVQQM